MTVDSIRERPLRPHGRARARAFAITPTARPWLEREPGECQWPVGEPDIPMRQLSCGAPVAGRGPYCARHHALGTRPPEPPPLAEIEALLTWLQVRRT